MIIITPTIKYGSTYYNTFTMGVCSNYHGYFFQCTLNITGMAVGKGLHNFGLIKKTGNWLPHELSERQLENRKMICELLLE